MAAALSQHMDTFTLPSIRVMKDPEKFLISSTYSFKARARFDNGQYSEPIMYVNMFKAWMKERVQEKLRSKIQIKRKDFCIENALSSQRLVEMENSVCEIASRLNRYLPDDSKALKEVKTLLWMLRSEVDDEYYREVAGEELSKPTQSRTGNGTKESVRSDNHIEDHHLGQSRDCNFTSVEVDKLFCSDMVLVKVLLVATFNPNYVVGRIDRQLPGDKSISDMGYDPRSTVIVEDLDELLVGRNTKQTIQQIIQLMCDPKRFTFGTGGSSNQLFLEFEKTDGMDHENSVIHDVPLKAHAVNHYGEACRKSFYLQVSTEIQDKMRPRQTQIQMSRPRQPYQIHWEYEDDKYDAMTCILDGWRNPIGFACEVREVDHVAVAVALQGNTSNEYCRVDGITVLPPDCGGVLAIVMLMLFLPHRYGIDVVVKNGKITTTRFRGNPYHIPDDTPINVEILKLMNEIRQNLSELFITPDDFTKIPNSDLDDRIRYLIHTVRSQQRTESADVAANAMSTEDGDHVSHFKLQGSASAHKSSLSLVSDDDDSDGDDNKDDDPADDVDTFTFLKPFNIEKFEELLTIEAEGIDADTEGEAGSSEIVREPEGI
ncbi:uncharacterized protein LOC144432940 [Glandiceps talaboti]